MNRLLIPLALATLVGCAHDPYAVHTGLAVDWDHIQDAPQYHRDLHECTEVSRQVPGAGETAAAGAIGGALIGALVGVLVGDTGDFALQGAGIGAASGALGGAGHGAMSRDQVVKNCMRGRGYNILN